MLETAKNAQFDADVNAIKGMRGVIRKFTKRLGEAGPAFKAWLQVLPTDSYGSVICGGFTVIIDAAIRHKDLCEEVFGALGDIPEIIKDAEFCFEEYKSEELYKRVAKLYTVITETLKGILSFYKERASGRHFRAVLNAAKAIAKGPNYGRTIQAEIMNVKIAASAVKQESDRCLQRRVGEIKHGQEYLILQGAHARMTNTESLNINQKLYADFLDRCKCWDLRWRETEAQWRKTQADNFALRNELTDLKHAMTPKPTPRNGPSPGRFFSY